MRRWKPQPSWRRRAAVAALVVAMVAMLGVTLPLGRDLLRPLIEWPINRDLFLRLLISLALVVTTIVMAYRVATAFTLTYAVDRNGLYISWLGSSVVISLQAIRSIEQGVRLPMSNGSPFADLGYLHGQVQLADGRRLHRFTTQPLANSLLVYTAEEVYAIAPQDPTAFIQDLEQRQRIGAAQIRPLEVEVVRPFIYLFWEDPLIRTSLLVAVGMNLGLAGWLMSIYPDLPAMIDLRANALGAPTTMAPGYQILLLPLAGAVIGLLNSVIALLLYRQEPTGARLLLMGAFVVQLLFLVAALTILR